MKTTYAGRRMGTADRLYPGKPLIDRDGFAPRPMEWWEAQAQALNGEPCARCGNGWTQGRAIQIETGECAVITNCLVCGHEVCHISGMDLRPLRRHERPEEA